MGNATSNTKREVRFDIHADEIIDPETTITIQLPAAVDAQGAQAAVRVKRGGDELPARISLGRNGRSIRVALGEAAATLFGAYSLEVGELLSVKGERINEQMRLAILRSTDRGERPQRAARRTQCPSRIR